MTNNCFYFAYYLITKDYTAQNIMQKAYYEAIKAANSHQAVCPLKRFMIL